MGDMEEVVVMGMGDVEDIMMTLQRKLQESGFGLQAFIWLMTSAWLHHFLKLMGLKKRSSKVHAFPPLVPGSS